MCNSSRVPGSLERKGPLKRRRRRDVKGNREMRRGSRGVDKWVYEEICISRVQSGWQVFHLMLDGNTGSPEELSAKDTDDGSMPVVSSEALGAQVPSVATEVINRSAALNTQQGRSVVKHADSQGAAQHHGPPGVSIAGCYG
eukprot:GFKZ01013554.1.p2 GENE.GFKZ01013554.1~~GFKZ01013554.1.p2  ORF type:complete len:142 (-),score=12.77 GFKZ01013554.1:1754-2179(-)